MKEKRSGPHAICVCGCANEEHSTSGSCSSCRDCLSFRLKPPKKEVAPEKLDENADEEAEVTPEDVL